MLSLLEGKGREIAPHTRHWTDDLPCSSCDLVLTSPVRLLSVVATLAAAAVAGAFLLTIDGDALAMMRYQRRIGELPYAVGIGWVVLAPLLFIFAAAYVAVSRAPWLLLCTVHLAVLVAVSLEFREMMSVGYWVAATVFAVAALASAFAAAGGDKVRRGDF